MLVNNVPLWSVTTWDKKYNAVDKTWQPKTIKYKYLLSDELDKISVKNGNVRLLYTGKDIGHTTETLAGDALSEGEIVAIPWGGTPSVKYFKGKFVTGDNRIATSNNPEELLNKYLYYYLLGNLKELSSYYRGAGLKHPSMKDVLKMRISYPSAEVQKRIIKQFDLLLDVVEMRKLQLQQLDELVKARFVELFGDGESPIKTVEELCTAIVDCPHSTPKYEGKLKNPAIRTAEIKKGYIAWETMRYVSDEEYEERIARLKPEAGDIVYGREGTFGNAAILPQGYNFCLGQRVMLLRPDYSKCTSEYLLYAVISDDVYRQAVEKNNASTVAHVNVKDVKQFKVPLPSFDKQNQFATFVEQVDKSKVAVQKALDEAQTLFDSLMQKYFEN